jgi:hypothetical protein
MQHLVGGGVKIERSSDMCHDDHQKGRICSLLKLGAVYGAKDDNLMRQTALL